MAGQEREHGWFRAKKDNDMHVKAPIRIDRVDLEERESHLKEFIRAAMACGASGNRSVHLLARSPDCLAARTLFAMSAELAAAGFSAEIVFAAGATVTAGEAWNLSFDPTFNHETRLLRDARFLDGHEQIVCGAAHVWFGDSMRREADKRDAFSSFIADNAETCARARRTFARIWGAAEPVYTHADPRRTTTGAGAAGASIGAGMSAGAGATLGAWRPTDQH